MENKQEARNLIVTTGNFCRNSIGKSTLDLLCFLLFYDGVLIFLNKHPIFLDKVFLLTNGNHQSGHII